MRTTSNLHGLDLELSQNTRALETVTEIKLKDEAPTIRASNKKLIEKNELLDSLDLNVGMDALVKL